MAQQTKKNYIKYTFLKLGLNGKNMNTVNKEAINDLDETNVR